MAQEASNGAAAALSFTVFRPDPSLLAGSRADRNRSVCRVAILGLMILLIGEATVNVASSVGLVNPAPLLSWLSLARPKSSSLIPALVTRMFAGFRIAMRDAVLARGVEGIANVCSILQCLIERQRSLERRLLDQLQ